MPSPRRAQPEVRVVQGQHAESGCLARFVRLSTAWTSWRSQNAPNSGDARSRRATSVFQAGSSRCSAIAARYSATIRPAVSSQSTITRRQRGIGEAQPEDVPVLDRDLLEVVEEAPVRLVERDQVETGVEDARREGLELVDQRLHGRAELRALVGDGRRCHAGEREQVRALVPVELQRSRDRVEHLGGRIDVAALLEPRVPRDADTCELCDLLATQARGAPSPRQPQPDVLGPDTLAPAAEERPELAAARIAAVSLREEKLGRHLESRHRPQYGHRAAV